MPMLRTTQLVPAHASLLLNKSNNVPFYESDDLGQRQIQENRESRLERNPLTFKKEGQVHLVKVYSLCLLDRGMFFVASLEYKKDM